MKRDFDPKKIQKTPIEQVTPNGWNPKEEATAEFEKLKASIETNGLMGAIAVREVKGGYEIIDGQQRYTAAKQLGYKNIYIYNEGKVTDTQAKALTIWWQQQVPFKPQLEAILVESLTIEAPEIVLPYNELELSELLMPTEIDLTQYFDEVEAHNPNPEEDEIPEPPKTPVSKLGDLWLLDGHRVLCGDSTDKATVERLMAGKKADIVFTDPPYGMNLDTDYSKLPSTKAQGNKTHKAVIGDNQPFNYQQFAWIQCKEQIWFGANYYAKTLPDEGSWLVWDKRVEEKFDRMFGSGFEIAWSKTPHKQKIYRHNNTLFGGDTEARGKEHPTQKPTKLLVEMMDDMFKGSKSVLDLFLGSGSTLIACEQTNRQCYGLELDPQYVDVICKRYQTLTGTLPILESTGEAHDFSS